MSISPHKPARYPSIAAVAPYLMWCFVALPTGAQTQAAGDQNPAEVSSHETPATFKSKVNLVLVPVVVRDAQGRAVGNLKQEDFQILDRGKPQVISKFSVEKSERQVTGEKERPGGNAAETAPGASAAPVAPEGYVAYLFDDVHLAFGDLVRVRDATDRHLSSLESTDRAAIFSTSGQTTLDFTDDRAKLHETLLRLQPRPITSTPKAGAECPDISYYMADLIENKNDTQALAVATQEVMVCQNLPPSQSAIATATVRMV